ncbi:MAG: GatB/YqeY domain-containing protein [Sciscionella sp.]
MAELKAKLRADLTTAMKARDTQRVATLRMALSAVTNEEVAGKAARELTDADVQKVLAREVKKRKEATEAFAGAGRAEQAAAEEAEGALLAEYLPAQLADSELEVLVTEAVEQVTAELGAVPGPKQMGQVMKLANANVAGRAEGGRVAAVVKAKLVG